MTSEALRSLHRLRVRTTALALATTVIVLLGAGLLLVGAVERALIDGADRRLASAASYVALAEADLLPLPTSAPNGEELAQLVDDTGRIVYATPRLEGRPPIMPVIGDRDTTPVTVDAGDLGRLRTIAVPFQGGTLLIASPLQSVDDATSTLRRAIVLGLPTLSLVMGVILWFVTGRALRPAAAAIAREEQLVADVSHELRNPLTGIRLLLESEADGGTDGGAVVMTGDRREALAAVDRLDTIAQGLLAIARSDGGLAPSSRRPVDLDDVVLARAAAMRAATTVHIDTSAVSGGQVVGDAGALQSLVENLLTNAVRFARSTVRVTVAEHGDHVDLVVADDGPGVPVADRERIFERFTRLDDARSRDRGGSGLGLAIVRAVVTDHGGSISVDDTPGGGATFSVRLPAGVPGR